MKIQIVPTLISAAIMAVTVLAVSFLSRFMPFALLYHVIVYTVAWGLYQALPGGFAKHFNIPDTKKVDRASKPDGPLAVAYYTMVIHTTTGFGDVYPLTWLARMITMMHMVLVYIATASLMPFTLSSRALG
jgi:hypothetical protein